MAVLFLFGIVIFVVYVFVEADNNEKQRQQLRIKQAEKERKNREYFEEYIEIPLKSFYTKLELYWNRPDSPAMITRLLAFDEDDLVYEQQIHGQKWRSVLSHRCECWIDDDILYFLDPYDSVKQRAIEYPQTYSTDTAIASSVYRCAIPLTNLQQLIGGGEILYSSEVVSPGSSTYTGVTVNGISFGEITHTPDVVKTSRNDFRYIILEYEDDEFEIQKIFFTYESADILLNELEKYSSSIT